MWKKQEQWDVVLTVSNMLWQYTSHCYASEFVIKKTPYLDLAFMVELWVCIETLFRKSYIAASFHCQASPCWNLGDQRVPVRYPDSKFHGVNIGAT